MVNLNITKREAGSVDELRASGMVPAVMYGRNFKSTSITVSAVDFLKAFKQAGESSIVALKGDGIDEQTLIHDVTLDPVTSVPTHADFYVVDKNQTVTVSVPLNFIGESPAIKLGGDLVTVMRELEIEAMPKDLPHDLTVDLSALVDFESQIHAKDIVLPAGVTLLANPDDVIVLVQEHKEEEEAPAVEFDATKIAVEERGKKEEEEAAA